MNYFYADANGQPAGPLPLDQIKSMGLPPETFVIEENGLEWKALSSIDETPAQPAPSQPTTHAGTPASNHTSNMVGSPDQPTKLSLLALFSLILGIMGFIGSCAAPFNLPLAIAAIVCGHLGLLRIKASLGTITGKGLALAGLIIGYISLLFAIIFLVFLLMGLSALGSDLESILQDVQRQLEEQQNEMSESSEDTQAEEPTDNQENSENSSSADSDSSQSDSSVETADGDNPE